MMSASPAVRSRRWRQPSPRPDTPTPMLLTPPRRTRAVVAGGCGGRVGGDAAARVLARRCGRGSDGAARRGTPLWQRAGLLERGPRGAAFDRGVPSLEQDPPPRPAGRHDRGRLHHRCHRCGRGAGRTAPPSQAEPSCSGRSTSGERREGLPAAADPDSLVTANPSGSGWTVLDVGGSVRRSRMHRQRVGSE